jgi:large subunit ribosomal protein L18
MTIKNVQSRVRRHKKVRAKISGTASLPRVAIFRSNAHIYAQVIDDVSAKTIFGSSDKNLKGTKSEKALALGKLVAEAITKTGVKKALFDRGGFKYHGRVQKLAEGLREGGLTV